MKYSTISVPVLENPVILIERGIVAVTSCDNGVIEKHSRRFAVIRLIDSIVVQLTERQSWQSQSNHTGKN